MGANNRNILVGTMTVTYPPYLGGGLTEGGRGRQEAALGTGRGWLAAVHQFLLRLFCAGMVL